MKKTNQEINAIIMRGCLGGAKCNGCKHFNFGKGTCNKTGLEVPNTYIDANGFIAYIKPTNCPLKK